MRKLRFVYHIEFLSIVSQLMLDWHALSLERVLGFHIVSWKAEKERVMWKVEVG